jgi:hypothetical protein
MKLSNFDYLFKVDPTQCTGCPNNLNEFLMKTFPEKGYRIGKEARAYEAIYDKYLLGEITDFKTEWAKSININPEIIPDEILQIDKQSIELFTRKDHKTIYYKSTVLTFTKAWHKLMKDFCNTDMELIDYDFSYLILKDGQKLQVENLPFVNAFYDCVKFYFDPKAWAKEQKEVEKYSHLESLVTKFSARAISNSKYNSGNFKNNNLLICSLIVLEEKKIKENFYKAA